MIFKTPQTHNRPKHVQVQKHCRVYLPAPTDNKNIQPIWEEELWLII